MFADDFVGLMRLTKPSLMTSVPVLGEPWSILGEYSQYI